LEYCDLAKAIGIKPIADTVQTPVCLPSEVWNTLVSLMQPVAQNATSSIMQRTVVILTVCPPLPTAPVRLRSAGLQRGLFLQVPVIAALAAVTAMTIPPKSISDVPAGSNQAKATQKRHKAE
jgi:hypothetical protein